MFIPLFAITMALEITWANLSIVKELAARHVVQVINAVLNTMVNK